jgi:hypothetical protein
MNRHFLYISLVLLVFLTSLSCKSLKSNSGIGLKEKSARAVINRYEDNFADFKTANGTMKAKYKAEEGSQSITISYRLEKNKAIWMSAKLMGLLTVAKVYITPDRFMYYEKINKTYFDGDFSMAEEFLGVDVNFQNLQNLLIGKPMFDLEKKQMLFDQDTYIFLQNIKNVLAYSASIGGRQFEMKSQSLRNQNNESLVIDYEGFQLINQKKFPSKIRMTAQNRDDKVIIDLDYRSVSFDEELSFPFSIPNNYDLLEF